MIVPSEFSEIKLIGTVFGMNWITPADARSEKALNRCGTRILLFATKCGCSVCSVKANAEKPTRPSAYLRNEISGFYVWCETMMPSRMEEVLIENLISLNLFAVFLFAVISRLYELICDYLIFNLTTRTVVVSIVSHEWADKFIMALLCVSEVK